MGRMSEVVSIKNSVPEFLLKHPLCATTRVGKNTYLPIKNMSPVHRPNAKLPKVLTGRKPKLLSCPVESASKRFWYECPKCHRFRNFIEDRDQFILYGVTRLWPTPPPAPPTFSSPQIGDSSSVDCLQGAYNICRVFHTSSAKLHPRNSQRKRNIIIPSTGFIRTSPSRNKARPKRKRRQSITCNTSPCSSNANSTSSDLAHMVEMLRRYVSPNDHFVLKRSVSSSTNVTKIVTDKTAPKQENTTNVLPPTQPAVPTLKTSSPNTPRVVVRRFTKCKSVNTTSSHSACLSSSNAHQSASAAKLESWTKRLRNGVYIKNTKSSILENGRGQVTQRSVKSGGLKKRNMKHKTKPKKVTSSVAKSTDASQTNSIASPRPDVGETSSGKESVVSKSGKSSPKTGLWSLGGETLMTAILSSSRIESCQQRRRIKTKKRARSFSARPSSASREIQEETTINTEVTTHIEAVKISEDKSTSSKRKPTSHLKMKKSTGSVNLLEKNGTSQANSTSGDDKATSVISSSSPYSPKNASDPEGFLEDFRNRMKRCQGKGFIKASHIEVIAYLEGKKSDSKIQAVPKTYQQMGLAPLTRSESSENCTHFLNFKCALSDTEAVPKLALAGPGRKRRKKKKKKSKSTPSSPRKKSEGENAVKETDEMRSASRQVKKTASSGRHKSQSRHGHLQNARMASASTAFSVTALPIR